MFAPGDLLNDLAPTCACGAVFDIRLCAPQILPCSHTFCLMCLSKDFQRKKKKCMICEKKYKTFNLNIALAEAIERISIRKDTVYACSRRCDECDSRWPLAQMRRCLSCESDIAHVIGNSAAVACILCLECAVDRHVGHSISRVNQPHRYLNGDYRSSIASSGCSSMNSQTSPPSISLGGKMMSPPFVQHKSAPQCSSGPPSNFAPGHTNRSRGIYGNEGLTVTRTNDQKVVEQTSPVYLIKMNRSRSRPVPYGIEFRKAKLESLTNGTKIQKYNFNTACSQRPSKLDKHRLKALIQKNGCQTIIGRTDKLFPHDQLQPSSFNSICVPNDRQDSTHPSTMESVPVPVRKLSRNGITLCRLSSLMRKREPQRMNERNASPNSTQGVQPSLSSGFSTDNECEEIKDLTYATLSDDVTPCGDMPMPQRASDPVTSVMGRPIGAYVNMISRSVECLSRPDRNTYSYAYVY